jgi:Domain of unknown function (DUF4129)
VRPAPFPRAGRPPDPATARRQAREILSQRRFRPARVPQPLRGVLQWLGDRLRWVGDLVDRLTASWAGRLTLGIAFVVVVALAARYLAGRRGAASGGRPRVGLAAARRADPDQLDRDADAAERRGDLERALRLRFAAGLLRLDSVGAIELRPSMTSGQVARKLRTPTYDTLARTFDAVAYGHRPATPGDVAAARAGWRELVSTVRPRR